MCVCACTRRHRTSEITSCMSCKKSLSSTFCLIRVCSYMCTMLQHPFLQMLSIWTLIVWTESVSILFNSLSSLLTPSVVFIALFWGTIINVPSMNCPSHLTSQSFNLHLFWSAICAWSLIEFWFSICKFLSAICAWSPIREFLSPILKVLMTLRWELLSNLYGLIYMRVLISHPRVLISQPRVLISHLWVLISHLWVLISHLWVLLLIVKCGWMGMLGISKSANAWSLTSLPVLVENPLHFATMLAYFMLVETREVIECACTAEAGALVGLILATAGPPHGLPVGSMWQAAALSTATTYKHALVYLFIHAGEGGGWVGWLACYECTCVMSCCVWKGAYGYDK